MKYNQNTNAAIDKYYKVAGDCQKLYKTSLTSLIIFQQLVNLCDRTC